MINRIIDICAKNKFLVLLFIGVANVVPFRHYKPDNAVEAVTMFVVTVLAFAFGIFFLLPPRRG